MNVVFDGVCLADAPITGVGRAFLGALAAYVRLSPGDATLLVPNGAERPSIEGLRIVGAPRGALRRQFVLPRLLRDLGADVLHSSVVAVPLRARCATIATAHDLPWLHEESGERSSWRRRAATGAALRAATAIVAPSHFTRDDVLRIVDRTDVVHVVPHGVNLPDDTAAESRSGPLVALGDDRPRKNRVRVARAHQLAAKTASLPPLRFVGPPDDYVDEAEKERLLRTCRAVVQCSLFEGFGMPVLEALAFGAPLVCSDIPPFREIADGIATFVDPRDERAIADGIVRALATAPERIAAGRARARELSTAATAARWRELHRAVVGAHR